MSVCRETACTNCSHREVCKFKEEFLKAQTAVNDVTVYLGENRMVKLRDIAYIPTVDLRCNYYDYSKGGTIR
jgi:hypothetical protein